MYFLSRFSLASSLDTAHWAAEVKQRVMSDSCPVSSATFCHTCSQETKTSQACILISQKLTFSPFFWGIALKHLLIGFCLGQILKATGFEVTRDFFPRPEIKIHNQILFSKQVAKLGLRRLQGQVIA